MFILVVTSEECTRWLPEHGADPNIASWNGYTALGSALESGTMATIELLESHGARFQPKSEAVVCDIVTRKRDDPHMLPAQVRARTWCRS